MKKFLLLTPFLFPAISNAQCVAGSGMCGPTATPQSISFIIFIIATIILIVYLSHFSKKVAIKEMLKAFIDKEVIVVSFFCSALLVLLFNSLYDNSLGALMLGGGSIQYEMSLKMFQQIAFGTFFTILSFIPPLYFVFTRGWRHFIACFIDMVLLVGIISLLIQRM